MEEFLIIFCFSLIVLLLAKLLDYSLDAFNRGRFSFKSSNRCNPKTFFVMDISDIKKNKELLITHNLYCLPNVICFHRDDGCQQGIPAFPEISQIDDTRLTVKFDCDFSGRLFCKPQEGDKKCLA